MGKAIPYTQEKQDQDCEMVSPAGQEVKETNIPLALYETVHQIRTLDQTILIVPKVDISKDRFKEGLAVDWIEILPRFIKAFQSSRAREW